MMLTIHDLLADKTYKKYICSIPALPPHYTKDMKPWRLIVKLKGEDHYRVKRYESYPEMFAAFKRLLPRIEDAALNCPPIGHQPPERVVKIKGKFHTNAKGERQQVTRLVTWKPAMPPGEYEDHHWCPYCRRPSVFKRFTYHPVLKNAAGGLPIDPELLRCTLCGASENIVPLRSN